MLANFLDGSWVRAGRVWAALMLALLASGCTSFGAAQLVSAPLGAEVINLEDDTNLGTTPVRVWWQARSGDPRYISVRFQKEGFQDKVTAFWVNMRHGSKDSALSNAVQVKVELDKKRGAR